MSINNLIEIRETAKKGLGVFAKVDIPAGTLILSEKPLLRVGNPWYLKAELQEVFDALKPEDQARFLSLHSAHEQNPDDYPKYGPHPSLPMFDRQRIVEQHEARLARERSVLSTMMTNAMECDGGAAVFEIASRFNHSCLPNAYFSWNKKIEQECVRVTKDVKAGEEILLCYIDPYDDITMRRWELQSYGFVCDCRLCVEDHNDPDEFYVKAEDRRWRLRDLDDAEHSSDGDRLRAKVEQAALLREEGAVNVILANVYMEIARLMEKMRQPTYAQSAAEKALRLYTICLGADSDNARHAAKKVRTLGRVQGNI